MNEISKKYIELAHKNAEPFINNPNVAAVIITGSVAKGYADDYSDIDTLVLYHNNMIEQEFQEIVNECKSEGGDLYHGTAEEGFAVYKYVEGVKCDFGHGVKKETEDLINGMIEKPDIDEIKSLMITGFIESYIIHGHEWVNEWKEKAKKYPDALTEMMIKKHLHFHPKWVLEKMGVERGDNLFLYETFVKAVQDILGILYAVNKMYHPGKLKGSWYYINQMKIKPHNLLEKLESLFTLSREESVKVLCRLINDILNIIDKHVPSYSTERARKVFAMELRKELEG